MMADASARLSLPHLHGGLPTRLKAAGNDLVLRARLLAEAAAGFPGRPEDFGSALAEDRDRAGRFPGWPVALIRDLGRAGEGAEAVMLSEALARADPARRAFFGGQAGLALAEAGLADDARLKIAEHVGRWPDDVQTRMLAGDALALLGDAEAALAQYQAALPLAHQAKDYRLPVCCPEGSSGSLILAALTRRCGAASRAPSRADRSGKASADQTTAATISASVALSSFRKGAITIPLRRCCQEAGVKTFGRSARYSVTSSASNVSSRPAWSSLKAQIPPQSSGGPSRLPPVQRG
jgi:tetratricopeptide (TPR) repeat protein